MYHSISSRDENDYTVSPEQFRIQMDYVASSPSYQVTSTTFDDGYENNYINAFPILKKLGIKAYFFIIVSKVGKNGYMSWEQLRELKEAGMFIGSHSMTHKILTYLNNQELDYELKVSKRFIEYNLKHKVEYLSIPKGYYNRNVIEKAKKAGYKGVFTSNPDDNDGFKLGRIAIRDDWDIEYFRRVINNGLPFGNKLKETAKGTAKKLMGHNNYDKLRKVILKSR